MLPWFGSTGRLRKASHKEVPLVSSLESDGSLNDPFVPNDFVADGSHPMSLEISSDDGGLDKALFDFYMDHKVKCLKRKLSSVGRRNVELLSVFFIEKGIVFVFFTQLHVIIKIGSILGVKWSF